MAVALNPRAERLLARLPRFTVYSVLELLLMALVAVQAARLFWALLTPLGPVGEYRTLSAAPPTAASAATLAAFDPFFRTDPAAAAAPVVVTALNLRLAGVREDRATGRGTAFITLPDGTQQSFVVGEEIEPGVTLTAVGFDFITVTRNGAAEQLFLDGAPPAPTPGTAPAPGVSNIPAPPGASPQPQPQPPVCIAPPPPPPSAQQGNIVR